jgi:hypothetical protein
MDGSRFCGPEAYIILGAPFMKKNTKLGMRVNIYLEPHTGLWKGPVQLRGPEA